MNDFIKFIVGTTLGLLVAALVAFNALLLWVATGPRSLDRLSPYIAKAFEPADHSYEVRIGQTWLIWDGWKHPIDIRLRDVTVLTGQGQVFSSFPEISVGLDVLSLLRMRVLPTSLAIVHPVISLFQNADHSISFGFQKQAEESPTPSVPFSAVLAPLLTPGESLSKLRLVTILDADASVGSQAKGVFFKASHANIIFRRNRQGVVQADADTVILYGEYQSTLAVQCVLIGGAPTAEATFKFGPIIPSELGALFSDEPLLRTAHFPLSGSGKLSISKDGVIEKLAFTVDGGKGGIESDKLEAPLAVDALHAEGQIANQGNDIQINVLAANLGSVEVAASGIVSRSDNDMSVRANLSLKNASATDVHRLWPPGLSPESRKWVIENIREGSVPQATVRIAIPFGDLAKPNLPKGDIDASIMLTGGKIRYLPEHPDVTHVTGVVHIDAVSLEATLQAGEFLHDTKLSNGKLLIEDLNVDNPYIKLNFEATASAKDIVRLLELPRLKHAAKLGLRDSAEGAAHGNATLGFHFFAPRDGKAADDFTYDITADLKAVSQPGFMKKFDISAADGRIAVNNSGLEFKGSGTVNGASVSAADVRYLFAPDKGFDTFIDVTATVPAEALPRFGYPAFPFLHGVIGVKGSVKQGAAQESSNAAIDLTNATLALDVLRWNKPDKEPASVELTAEKKEGLARIPSFHLKGHDMEAHGAAELDKEFTIRYVEMDRLKHGDNDLRHMIYETSASGYHIEAEGASADASPWLEPDGGKESTFSFEHFPALALKLDTRRLVLGKGRELDAVKGDANCDTIRCNNANVSGKTTDGKPFAFRILKNPKGMRQLSLHAQNAGAFLKGTGLLDSMEGGDLTITGNYMDSGRDSSLKARADIRDYTIKHAPVLARILSLASLTGFFDTLGGNGIHFERLVAPFTLANDVINIEKGKMHGPAIGMTADGTITFPKQVIELQGTLVPSYTLNSFFDKVPLLGHIITGGEGQGIIAARYSVHGFVDNPEVVVNPLSILTPGFLRGLFDIFDTPTKGKEE